MMKPAMGITRPKDPPVGRLRITRFFAESDGMAGLSVHFNPYHAVRIELEDSLFPQTGLTGRQVGEFHGPHE
jgi:hypothetical protein